VRVHIWATLVRGISAVCLRRGEVGPGAYLCSSGGPSAFSRLLDVLSGVHVVNLLVRKITLTRSVQFQDRNWGNNPMLGMPSPQTQSLAKSLKIHKYPLCPPSFLSSSFVSSHLALNRSAHASSSAVLTYRLATDSEPEKSHLESKGLLTTRG